MTTRGVGLSEEEREALVEALAMDLMAEEHVGRADLRMHPLEWHWRERFSDDDRKEYLSLARAALRSPVLAAHTADLAAQVARVAKVADWLADKEADWSVSARRGGDSYAEGARDVCDVAESRLRAALSPARPDDMCPTCGSRKVSTDGVRWCAVCDDCPTPQPDTERGETG